MLRKSTRTGRSSPSKSSRSVQFAEGSLLASPQVASSDLVNMGITVVSYTLKDIRDEEGYLKVRAQGSQQIKNEVVIRI